ncbi:hypothetical protein Tco_1446170, partial [Tanacetum coccineum]
MSPKNKAHYQSKKEAIHLLLTGIGDEIYSITDACKTAHDMCLANFTSHDGESMESYYSRFYKMKNEMIRNNLTVATMQVNVQFLQQLQPEWSSSGHRPKLLTPRTIISELVPNIPSSTPYVPPTKNDSE